MFGGLDFSLKRASRNAGIPLFNLHITLNDWQGPFEDFYYFLNIAKIAKEQSHFIGNHHVNSEGEIRDGLVKGLHTFEAEMDLTQKNHLHYGKAWRVLPLQGSAVADLVNLLPYPRYTLEGLYGTIPTDERSIDSKIEKLSQELKMVEFRSIAKNPKTRLKLLENKYRREISDQ